MKTRYYQYAVIAIAAMQLMACNGIETVGLDADSVISKHKTSLIRDVNVTQNEAIGIANMFAHSNAGSDNPQTKGAFSSTKMISSSETISEDGQNLMYVFNYEGGGFVIVGSTRNYYPILAYSDEGSFVLKEDMEAVDVWLDETKVCIKNSSSLSDDTKAQMQNLWARYDGTYVDPTPELLTARRPQTRSTGEDACWEEIEDLQALHGSEGWTFLPLSQVEDIFEDAGLSSYYDNICYNAEQNHSALNETVIGYKNSPIYTEVGPLLQTIWHQSNPFDRMRNGYLPGCATIAAAQVMKYLEYPPTLYLNESNCTWSDIPAYIDYSTNSKQPYLVKMIADTISMNYGTFYSWTIPSNVTSGLNSMGFSSYAYSHNTIAVRNEVIVNGRPVIMVGSKVNLSLPTYTNPFGNCHYWVCDGTKETITNQITFFTENQPNGNGEFTQGLYSYSNPGVIGGLITRQYHMNWGWGGVQDGWYADNNLPTDYNYQYSRQDLFVSAP